MTASTGKTRRGCYITFRVGFWLLLLAIMCIASISAQRKTTRSRKPVITSSKTEAAKPTTGSKTVTAEPQPTTTGSKAVTAGPQPTTTGSKTVTSGPQPTTTGSKTLKAGPQPTTTGSKTVTAGSQPKTTGSKTVTVTTNSGTTLNKATPVREATTLRPVTKPLSSSSYRLPKTLVPIHYDLELQPNTYGPDPSKFKCKGSVSILVKCESATDKIVLNLNGPKVDPSSIKVFPEGSPLPPLQDLYKSSQPDRQRQLFTIMLNETLQAGKKYWVVMNFTRSMDNLADGIYYSGYKKGNEIMFLTVTQFHPVYARSVFPCFDEPGLKATFTVTIVRPQDRVSMSNMPIDRTVEGFKQDGIAYMRDVFKQTPKMSTYTLGVVVCDFSNKSKATRKGTDLKFYGKSKSLELVEYALDMAVALNEYFHFLFEIKHPLQKQDLVLLSEFDATPNWGLQLYKESSMMYKPSLHTEQDKELAVRELAFGISQEWFGNLVTPAWWNDVWLTEGFSGFYEHTAVDRLNPDWRAYDSYVMDKLHAALLHDSTLANHPVVTDVEKPLDISDLFGWVTYMKAPSLVKMMYFILGNDTFHKGIKNYLKNYSYEVVTSNDLYKELTQQAKTDGRQIKLKEIMDTWILQMNYPVVTVSRDFNNHSALHVTQSRFLSDPLAKDPGIHQSPFKYRWTIPLTFASSRNARFDQSFQDIKWMYKEERTKTFNLESLLPNCSDTEGWVIANVEQQGFYRVNYQIGNWLALSRQLKKQHTVIGTVNRAQIINDAWSLARASYIPTDVALEVIDYLDKEHDRLPWYTAWLQLKYIKAVLAYTSLYGTFRMFVKAKIDKPFQHLGLMNVSTNHLEILTRSLIAEHGCEFSTDICSNESVKQYGAWMLKPADNKIPVDIRKAIYCQAIAIGRSAEFDFALRRYKTTQVESEKETLLFAMSCSKKMWTLNKYLHVLLETNTITSFRHALTLLTAVLQNPRGRYLAWDFYRVNYEELSAKFSSLQCADALPSIVETFNTELELSEVKAFWEKSCQFYDKHQFQHQVVEKIKTNIGWINRNIPVIRDWMKKKQYLQE